MRRVGSGSALTPRSYSIRLPLFSASAAANQ
jgi:hypothetical protein